MRYVPALSWWNQVVKSIGFHRGAWDYVDNPSEAPEVNYLKNPIHGVHQIQQLVDDLVPRLGAIRQPALICQSDQDPVVDPGSADRLREALGSEQRDLVGFNDQKHIIMNGPCRNQLYDRIGDWLREHAGINRSLAGR